MTNEEKQSLRSTIENHLSDLRKQFDACTDEEGLLEEEVELSARIDSMKWVLEMLDNTVDNIEKERESMKKHCEAYHMENFMSHTDGYFEKILQLIDTPK